jgi:hypothetical protein
MDTSMPVAMKSIWCGKKSYIDMLVDTDGNVGFHCRMKGVPNDCLAITANERYPNAIPCVLHKSLVRPLEEPLDENDEYSIYKLYEDLYKGKEIAFDLTKSSKPSFEFSKSYTVTSKQSFIRKLKFTSYELSWYV